MYWTLAPDEPPAFTVVNASGDTPFFLIADHASNRIPRALAQLGLPASALCQHIAYDLGIAELARALSASLNAPLVMSNYSRLVMDMNRRHDSPTRVVSASDGLAIPGNLALDATEIRRRTGLLFVPYHKAIRKLLHEKRQRHAGMHFISLHSFTPAMRGDTPRPWDIGVLWDQDGGFATPMINALRTHAGLVVGDNKPYSGKDPSGYTVATHAQTAGLANALLEVRQDHLATPDGVARWQTVIADALQKAFEIHARSVA
jgi:predicted N-formylglutamate amidohydrolase